LRDVNLRVAAGECLGITGPSGAGKTTLCRTLLGAIPSSTRLTPEQLPEHFRGSVTLFGEPVTAKTAATNRIGMVLQDPENQFLRMTLLHELALGLQIQGVPNAEIVQRSYAALCQVGLEYLWHGAAYLHPADLSGGQKQRVAIAAFLALRPEILIVDEPTTGQDARMVTSIMTLLRDIQQQGKTILIITHDMSLVAEYCQRVLTFDAGKVAFTGTPTELFANSALLQLTGLHSPATAALSNCLRTHQPDAPFLLTVEQWVNALS